MAQRCSWRTSATFTMVGWCSRISCERTVGALGSAQHHQERQASTLSVVTAVHKALQTVRAAAPPGMEIKELFDQSVFVKQSVTGA